MTIASYATSEEKIGIDTLAWLGFHHVKQVASRPKKPLLTQLPLHTNVASEEDLFLPVELWTMIWW
jgi:hypothetical protein